MIFLFYIKNRYVVFMSRPVVPLSDNNRTSLRERTQVSCNSVPPLCVQGHLGGEGCLFVCLLGMKLELLCFLYSPANPTGFHVLHGREADLVFGLGSAAFVQHVGHVSAAR